MGLKRNPATEPPVPVAPADDAGKRELYAAGQTARKSALKLLAEYEARAAELADILHTYQAHLATIDRANAELPEGASRIESPEPFNGRLARPQAYRTTFEDVVCYVGTKIRAMRGGVSSHPVETRRLETKVLDEAVPGIPHRPLTDNVSLPALGPDASPHWAPLIPRSTPTRFIP